MQVKKAAVKNSLPMKFEQVSDFNANHGMHHRKQEKVAKLKIIRKKEKRRNCARSRASAASATRKGSPRANTSASTFCRRGAHGRLSDLKDFSDDEEDEAPLRRRRDACCRD